MKLITLFILAFYSSLFSLSFENEYFKIENLSKSHIGAEITLYYECDTINVVSGTDSLIGVLNKTKCKFKSGHKTHGMACKVEIQNNKYRKYGLLKVTLLEIKDDYIVVKEKFKKFTISLKYIKGISSLPLCVLRSECIER